MDSLLPCNCTFANSIPCTLIWMSDQGGHDLASHRDDWTEQHPWHRHPRSKLIQEFRREMIFLHCMLLVDRANDFVSVLLEGPGTAWEEVNCIDETNPTLVYCRAGEEQKQGRQRWPFLQYLKRDLLWDHSRQELGSRGRGWPVASGFAVPSHVAIEGLPRKLSLWLPFARRQFYHHSKWIPW